MFVTVLLLVAACLYIAALGVLSRRHAERAQRASTCMHGVSTRTLCAECQAV